MPKLPDSFDVEGRSAPRPSYNVPDFPRNPVPAAIKELGQTIAGMGPDFAQGQRASAANAKRAQAERTKAMKFAQQTRLAQFANQWQEHYVARQASAEPGAPKFAETVVGDYDKEASKLMENVPPELKPEIDTKLVTLRGRLEKQATTFEGVEKNRFAKEQIKTSQDVLLDHQRGEPGQWQDIQREGEEHINNSPLPEIEKAKERAEWGKRRARNGFEADFEIDPEGALERILPPVGKTSKAVGDFPVLVADQPGRVSKGSTDGLNASLLEKFKATQNAFGKSIPIVSGFRDAKVNAKAGGAKGSQHLHGNAIDIDVTGMSVPDRRKLIETASANGITGIGIYKNSLHFDIGNRRVWGPSHHADSVPSWASASTAKHLSGKAVAPQKNVQVADAGNIQSDAQPEPANAAAPDPYEALSFEERVKMHKRGEEMLRKLNEQDEAAGKEQRHVLEREGFDLMIKDTLTQDWLDDHKDDIGISTYKTLARSLHKGSSGTTDEDTHISLLEKADTDPIEAVDAAKEAYREDRISKEVFTSILSRAEKRQAQGKGEAWQKDVRSFVRRSLDFGKGATAAQKERQLNALFAFDDYMQQSPDVPREEAMTKAKAIIDDYRRIKHAAARTELPLPKYSTGTRASYSIETLASDKQLLRQKLIAKEITASEAEREARNLMEWEKALGDAEDEKPGKKPKVNPGQL